MPNYTKCKFCQKEYLTGNAHSCTKVGRVSIDDSRDTGYDNGNTGIGISQGNDLDFWRNDTPSSEPAPSSSDNDSGGFGGGASDSY